MLNPNRPLPRLSPHFYHPRCACAPCSARRENIERTAREGALRRADEDACPAADSGFWG